MPISRDRVIPSAETLVGLGDSVPFLARLAQTVAWCESRPDTGAPPADFRTSHARPPTLPETRAEAVRVLGHCRGNVPASVSALAQLQGGRLLAYFPDAETADGAGEDETAGFFDVHDAPPWDTWVALFDDGDPKSAYSVYLVAFIPARVIHLGDAAIRVNAMDSLAWLGSTTVVVARSLREIGLLE
jgi:hypothetical protein